MKMYLKQAYKGIVSNKSRAVLTMLGIMIGIGTVVLVLSAGEGFKSYINSQIELFGSNTVTVQTVLPASTKARNNGAKDDENTALNAVPVTTFKNKDIADIKNIPNVKNAYGASISQKVTSYENVSKNTYIFGADSSRFEIDKGVLKAGRAFTEEEDKSLAQVAVLGYDIASDLFGENDPIGKLIRVDKYNFEVIGVYERRGSFGPSNDDEQVYIPITTLQKKILGVDYLFYGIVELEDPKKADTTVLDIEDLLYRNHNITDETKIDYKVQTQEENLATFNSILQAITFLLIAIAMISLVVGGVGVMNIMYVVVTERIGEVGLKKALGARNKDILYEFLLEAVMITLLGGILGIIFGILASYLVSKAMQGIGLSWSFIVPIFGIFLSASISTIVGVVFGVFPAINASKLNPIEALNKE